MKHSEYLKKLENNPEYQEASRRLETFFALGDAVIEARIKKGWTQSELAERVGTKQANISRIEAGLANPTLSLIVRLCAVLHLELLFQVKDAKSSKTGDLIPLDEALTGANIFQ